MTRFLSDSKPIRFIQTFVAICVLTPLIGWLLFRDPPTSHVFATIVTGIALGMVLAIVP